MLEILLFPFKVVVFVLKIALFVCLAGISLIMLPFLALLGLAVLFKIVF